MCWLNFNHKLLGKKGVIEIKSIFKLNCFVNTLQGIGTLVDIDIRSIVNTVLLEQTQQNDSSGAKTITTYYAAWYR